MAPEVLLAFTTFPEGEKARAVARELIAGGFAACANIVPAVESIYRWQGKVEQANEVLVLFKISAANYALFEAKLKSLHPYEVPEIITTKIEKGLPDYLRWVADNCSS